MYIFGFSTSQEDSNLTMIDANNYLEIWKRRKSGHSKSITRPLPLRRIAHVRICFLYDLEQKERYILFINFPQNMCIHLLLPLNNLICNLIVFVLLQKVYHSLCQNEFSTLKIMKNKKCPAKGNSKPSRQWCLGDYPLHYAGASTLLLCPRQEPTIWGDSQMKGDYWRLCFQN